MVVSFSVCDLVVSSRWDYSLIKILAKFCFLGRLSYNLNSRVYIWHKLDSKRFYLCQSQ